MTGPGRLSQLLADHDRWTGAACIGQWDLFDPREEDETRADFRERATLARSICQTCPISGACAEVAAILPRSRRIGMWAGIPYDQQGRPAQFSTRGTSEEP